MKSPSDDSRKLALLCRAAAENKKASDIVILDLKRVGSFTDYFIICSVASEPQLKAVANEVIGEARDVLARSPIGRDGAPVSQWIVVDFGDVTVHIFHESRRGFYKLEELWNDAPRVK